MKKKMMTLLSLLLAFALPLAAMAEEPEMDLLLEGLVTEIVEGGFVMEDINQGEVMVNTSEETVLDGVLMEEDLQAGMYVIVDFNGMMTFSLPPQVHADRVGCYRLSGSIAEILEDGSFLLTGDAVYDEVIVHTALEMNLFADMPVAVYYNGAVTMSLPAQAGGLHIIVPTLEGAVSDVTDEGFTLTDSEGVAYEVKMTEETLLSLQSEEIIEEEVTEEESAEEESTEEEVIEEEVTEEEVEVEVLMEDALAAEEEAEVILELMDGMNVKVIYNGMLTRSIPAQLTALEIVIAR